MAFNQKLSFLENIKHGLIVKNKTLEDITHYAGSASCLSIKTRLYQINKNKKISTPLDGSIVDFLINNCVGFKQWAKENKLNTK